MQLLFLILDIVRDPQPVEPVLTDVVQVFDLVGLNINGYVDGKPYYGNVYYVNGIRYAGTSVNSGTNIVVYDTQLASVQKRPIEGAIAPSQIEETETQEDTIEVYKFSNQRKLLYYTNKCSINHSSNTINNYNTSNWWWIFNSIHTSTSTNNTINTSTKHT